MVDEIRDTESMVADDRGCPRALQSSNSGTVRFPAASGRNIQSFLNADKNIEELMAAAARRPAENRGWAKPTDWQQGVLDGQLPAHL